MSEGLFAFMGSESQAPTPARDTQRTAPCPTSDVDHSVVQLLSRLQLFVTPWTAARQASLSFTISWSLLTLKSIKSMMPSNHLILCRPFLLLSSIFPSIWVFSSESALCIHWPKDWNLSFSISLSNEYSVLISFWIDWSDLLAIQGTRKSLLQHQSLSISNASQINTQGINTSVSKLPTVRMKPFSALDSFQTFLVPNACKEAFKTLILSQAP